MKVTYHGHSVVLIETNEKKIIIDPFINGNGQTTLSVSELEVDYILLSHGHNDHVGDTVELAKQNNALVVAPFELATYLSWQGVNTHAMHIGGAHQFDFGVVKLTQAFHGSAYVEEETKKIVYTGMPAGLLISLEGKTIYHAGDTALFSDMKVIGDRNRIDLAFLPIGDNFTMGPTDAALAATWLKAKQVVPIHYNTFPVIEQDPKVFCSLLEDGIEGKVLVSGETIEL
ncbi:metal-dependent hydrolase [Anaerobacillus sp. CMMVII]|uniref:metal-dependent hydrolase n=1 Tax=Anaerobacillus sp. CMMVII TaxID=2755588 RepID=UPI0021B7D309|nr:metal-dependent hydrolase [Anaerobacillus sp. CMMVII]MCT8137385.1 metal-dependent hydrolase [Anaerobacillus sp. CMMVII]